MSTNPNIRASPMRQSPSFLIQRKSDIAEPIPRSNLGCTILFDGDVLEFG